MRRSFLLRYFISKKPYLQSGPKLNGIYRHMTPSPSNSVRMLDLIESVPARNDTFDIV